jgi:hypothetical protein
LSAAYKKSIKNSKAGRVLRRPSGRPDFREFGDVGVAFLWSLAMNIPWHVHPLKQRETSEETEQLAAGQPPANGTQSCDALRYC